MFSHMELSFAVIAFVSGNASAFNSCRYRKGLGNGSRFISITDTEVLPECIQILIKHIRIILDLSQVLFIDILVHFLALGVQSPHSQKRLCISGIVQIIDRITGHRQDLSAVGIHYDAAGIVSAVSLTVIVMVLLVIFFQIFFHNALDIGVNGGDNAVSVLGGDRCPFQIRVVIQIPVFPSRRSGQNIIIIFLQAIGAHIVAGGEADHITGQGTARVASFIFLFKPKPLYQGILFIYKLHQALYLFVFQSSGKHIVSGAASVFRNIRADRRGVCTDLAF